jgi:predicted TIM-barrel fold metal-dependent hydrolase
MIEGMFIFDNVVHVYDMSDQNLRTDRSDTQHARETLVAFGDLYNPGMPFAKKWTTQEMHRMVFEEAPTDMAMAQVVPIFDWFKDWFAPVAMQHAMAAEYPDKVMFCGGVDPMYRGLNDALDHLDYQVKELGARSIKFYNGHVDVPWRCDDQRLAYPIYERARNLGIKVLQFHKGVPFGLQNVESLNPTDLQAPARDFPDLTFIIHHLSLPYFEETVSIAGRFPNVYLALSGNINHYVVAPRQVQHWLGRLLMDVGSDKLLWGSEAALSGGPMPYLKAFMDFEIPEDLRRGYGYPQITREDKEKILGLNMARLMDVDVQAKQRDLAAAASR